MKYFYFIALLLVLLPACSSALDSLDALNFDDLEQEAIQSNVLSDIKDPIPSTGINLWFKIVGAKCLTAYLQTKKSVKESWQWFVETIDIFNDEPCNCRHQHKRC